MVHIIAAVFIRIYNTCQTIQADHWELCHYIIIYKIENF